jgi:hypothetical protein
MINFEDMTLNHRPGDRVENSCIVQPDPVPTDRMALFFRWVDHAAVLLTVFFGEDCPLVTSGLHPLAKVLQSKKHFHNYTTTHWVALTWRIHLNIRAFFAEKGVGMAAVSAIRLRQWTLALGCSMERTSYPWIFQSRVLQNIKAEIALRQEGTELPDQTGPLRCPSGQNRMSGWQLGAQQCLPSFAHW